MACIHLSTPTFKGDFSEWRKKMGTYFRIDFDVALAMEEGYEPARDQDENLIKMIMWMKKRKDLYIIDGNTQASWWILFQELNKIEKNTRMLKNYRRS